VLTTRNEFAKVIGMSAGWVSKALDGGMPAVRSGRAGAKVQIDTAVALPWLLGRASERAAPTPDSQRDRLAREQADKVALENAQRRGELVPIAQVRAVASELVSRLGSALEGLPGRLANEIAGISDPAEIRARIGDEIRGARTAFAHGIEVMAGVAAGATAPGGAGASAAQAKPRAMGRRKPRAAARKRGTRTVSK